MMLKSEFVTVIFASIFANIRNNYFFNYLAL